MALPDNIPCIREMEHHNLIELEGNYVCTKCGIVFEQIMKPDVNIHDYSEPMVDNTGRKFKRMIEIMQLPDDIHYYAVELCSYKRVTNEIAFAILHIVAETEYRRHLDIAHYCGIFGLNVTKVRKYITEMSKSTNNKHDAILVSIATRIGLAPKDVIQLKKYTRSISRIMRSPKSVVGALMCLKNGIDSKTMANIVQVNHQTIDNCVKDVKKALKDVVD